MLSRQLLTGITVEQAAETQGLSERMLGRWMKGRGSWEADAGEVDEGQSQVGGRAIPDRRG